MSAGDVTDEEIQDFKRLFPASRRLATALEASRAEVAALRRQDAASGAICLGEHCASEIPALLAANPGYRLPTREECGVVAQDVVTVLRRFVDWCEKYPSSRIYDHCEILTIARIMDEIHADAKRALRSGEAPAQRGEG
jgi:hypothetical protein